VLEMSVAVDAPALTARRNSHLLTRVGPYKIAIPIETVISIHEAPLVFPVPCAQPGIAGAVRFAGIAVPVFDIRRSLRLEPREVAESDRLVLVDVKVRVMALIVDEVLEFVSIERLADEPAASLFADSPINTKVIAGIACAPDLCAVIDPAGILLPDLWDAPAIESAYEESINESHPLWARTAALAELPKMPGAIGVEAAIFRIGAQRFAVMLPSVVEFFTQTAHAAIPVRSNILVSLVNRRGQAIVLFDPRPLLGLAPAALPPVVDGIVLSGDHHLMALPVDRLEGLDVLSSSDNSQRPGRFCLSVHPSTDGAILLLDVPALLHHAQSAFISRQPATGAVA
jgi:purine-binding chemotaxis protein CheW